MPFSSIKRKSLPRNIIADTISTGTSDIYHSRKSTVVKKAAEGKGVNRLVRVVGPELLFPSAVSKTPRTRAKARLSLCNMSKPPGSLLMVIANNKNSFRLQSLIGTWVSAGDLRSSISPKPTMTPRTLLRAPPYTFGPHPFVFQKLQTP